jgi:DNA-binding beta-propeller fold protein YncE
MMIAFAFLAVAVLSVGAAGAAHYATQPSRITASGAPAPRHLYLTSPAAGAVYSFPLMNGVPSKTPSAIITGLSYPTGVAVDSAGYLYVSDVGTDFIDVFAPGANGPANPVRQIPTYAVFMTLWDKYLFAQGKQATINVFPTSGNGPTPPLGRIFFGASDAGLTSSPDGRLFFTWWSVDELTVYDRFVPSKSSLWAPPRQVVKLVSKYGGFLWGVAVDDREIYAELLTGGGPVRIGVLPIGSNGPTRLSRVMIASACTGGSMSVSYSLAIYSNYLYEACTSAQSVFIYDKRGSGRVNPLFSLTGPFIDIFTLALGP